MEEKAPESTDVPTISKEDQKIINSFKGINPDANNLVGLVRDLRNFNLELNSLKDISNFITEDNLYVLQNLNYRDNIRINLLLVKIYTNIISNQTLYSNYLVEYTEEKLHLILQIFDECITLIEKLGGFILDEELYKFKEKTLSLIKCIYFNWKGKITNLTITQKLEEYIDTLPEQFYSETLKKMNEEKESFDILNSNNPEKIKEFEDKFQQINNYFEQYEAFKKFVECNSGIINYYGIGDEGEPKKSQESGIVFDKIDFYLQYGMLLLKFCKYHFYIFLNQENKETQENNEQKTRVVFLLEKIKQYKEEEGNEINEENKGSKNIVELMSNKSFTSFNMSKEYDELIQKELNKYLEITKEFESEPKIKNIIDQMTYFLSSLKKESYVPLYLTNFGKITISDNFTPFFMINVSAGKKNEFYLETKMNATTLVFIEFNLENQSKDINFEINKYELYSDEFKNVFKEEKIETSFKLFLLCNGYALYQIVFDNYYSWFTSKDISYKITLLKMDEKPPKNLYIEENKEIKEEKEEENDDKENKEEIIEEKKEDIIEEKKVEKKEEKKEEIKQEEIKEEIKQEETKEEKKEIIIEENKADDKKFKCQINGKNLIFDTKDICQKIKSLSEKHDENLINIPIILYLSTIRIVSFKDKEISYKEFKENEDEEEGEEIITKSYFENRIKHYISKILKLKISDCKNKKIIISIFSQNRDLSLIDEEIAEKIKELKSPENNENISYLQKIGFIPSKEIEGYNVDFKLYDLCEQSLLYHLFNNINNEKEIKLPTLFLLFDKKVVNASLFNKDAIVNKIKGKGTKGINFNNININDDKSILELLKKVNNKYKGIEVGLSCVDYKNDEGKKLEKLIENIKKYCQDEIKVNVVTYDENQIAYNVFNYMNLFYEN